MTRTRRQTAQAVDEEPQAQKPEGPTGQAQGNSIVLDFGLAPNSQKISKQPKNRQNSDQPKKVAHDANANLQQKAAKGNGARGRPPKPNKKQAEIIITDDHTNIGANYNTELVNLSLIKPFDQDAVMDQTGNSNGDSHLPRATLNQIIRESLPVDVRAQKDTMDLICFISNAFIDLLSEVSNNVCYKYQKKNIVPEHVIRGLQHLNLDQYIPFMLTDNQNMSLTELLKSEKQKNVQCKGEGIHQFTQKQIINADRSQALREEIVGQMVKRLTNQQVTGAKRAPKKHAKRAWTAEEIEAQRKCFEGLRAGDSDDSEEGYGGEGATSNDSPSLAGVVKDDMNHHEPSQGLQVGQPGQQEWNNDEYRISWINHNKALLDQDYVPWAQGLVDQYIEFVAANPNEAQNYITDHDQFRQAYPPEYFYDIQYQEYIQSQQPMSDGQIQIQDNQQMTVQENQISQSQNQLIDNGHFQASNQQDNQCELQNDQLTVPGTLATTAEVSLGVPQKINAQQLTLTPANSIISPKAAKNDKQQLAQATSNTISYNVIKPDQIKQKQASKVQESKAEAPAGDVDFDEMDE